jgi:hypothetical protein
MLDEKLEYNLYLTKGYEGLLSNENLADSLKGLRRVLTVLARGFLDTCYAEKITDVHKQHIYTVSFLKVWLIGDEVSDICDDELKDALEEIAKYAKLNKQLKLAKKANLLSHMIENKIKFKSSKAFDADFCRSFLKKRISSWDKTMFPTGNFSSFNAIYFKGILADAYNRGPLTNSVLLVRCYSCANHGISGDFGEDNYSCMRGPGSAGKVYYRNSTHKIQKSRMAFILAIVALYLQGKPDNCEGVPVVWADLSNYIGKPCNKDKKKVFGSIVPFIQYGGYKYNGRFLFTKERVKDTFNKLTVDSNWLTDYDVHLAPADKPIPKGYVLYDDKDLCGIYLQNDKK